MRARRIATGLAVSAAVLGVAALDHYTATTYGTSVLITALCCWALLELYRILDAAGLPSRSRIAVAAAAVLLLLRAAAEPLGLLPWEAREIFLAGLAAAALAPIGLEIARGPEAEGPQPARLRTAAVTSFGLVYVVLLGSFLLELRLIEADGDPNVGLHLCLLLAAAVKIGDSCAYFVGRTLGRRPMCWVSPRKTWEGAGASALGSVATSVLAGMALGYDDARVWAGFGLVVSLSGQGGDLVESYVKRALGVKDSGATFGEIGGALDMMDALLLAAPAGYIWVQLLVLRGGFA